MGPRSSGALGFAQYLPKELMLHTREQLVDMICMALGGRASEDIQFGRVTTGASDDLKRVTQIARSMVSMYGMSERVGQVAYPMPGEYDFAKPFSEEMAAEIDKEIKSMVDELYVRTRELLVDNWEKVEKVAQLLLERESITHHDVVELCGPRPFEMDESVREYVSAGWSASVSKESEEDGAGSEEGSDDGAGTEEGSDDEASSAENSRK